MLDQIDTTESSNASRNDQICLVGASHFASNLMPPEFFTLPSLS